MMVMKTNIVHIKDNIKQTTGSVRSLLIDFDKPTNKSDVSQLKVFKLFVMREKQILIHMNYLHQPVNSQMFHGLVWVPTDIKFDQLINEKYNNGDLKPSYLDFERGADDIALTKPTYF